MLPFGVTIPATVPQRSEIPEGLMNYPVLNYILLLIHGNYLCFLYSSTFIKTTIRKFLYFIVVSCAVLDIVPKTSPKTQAKYAGTRIRPLKKKYHGISEYGLYVHWINLVILMMVHLNQIICWNCCSYQISKILCLWFRAS